MTEKYSVISRFQVQILFLDFNKVYICLTEELWILDPSNKCNFFPVNTDSSIITGMHQSAIEGNLDDIQFYLDHLQHDINPPSRWKKKTGRTPLHEAAIQGQVDVLKVFHENLPDMSINNSFGNNALHYAAYLGQMLAVEFLVNVISTDAVTHEGNNSLHMAAIKDKLSVVKYLADIIPLDAVNNDWPLWAKKSLTFFECDARNGWGARN